MKQTKPRRRAKKKNKGTFASLVKILAEMGTRAASFLRSARSHRRMQLVERVVLDNKHSVTLVRVDNQEFVIGCYPGSMILLGVREPQAETVPQTPTKEELVLAFRRAQ